MGPGLPGQRAVLSRRRPGVRRGAVGAARRAPSAPTSGRAPSTCSSRWPRATIKACWIICTNPVATVANRKTVIAGLEAAELVITQDAYRDTATNRYADIVLPAALWAESDARDGQLRAQPDPAAAVDPAAGRGAAGLAADLPGRRAHGLRRRLRLHSPARRSSTRSAGSANPRTGYDLRGASYERLRETPLQWPVPAGRRRDDRHPIRYLNDGVSQDLFVDEDGHRPRLAFPTPSRRAVFHAAAAHGRRPSCPTTTTRSCSTPVGCSTSGTP